MPDRRPAHSALMGYTLFADQVFHFKANKNLVIKLMFVTLSIYHVLQISSHCTLNFTQKCRYGVYFNLRCLLCIFHCCDHSRVFVNWIPRNNKPCCVAHSTRINTCADPALPLMTRRSGVWTNASKCTACLQPALQWKSV